MGQKTASSGTHATEAADSKILNLDAHIGSRINRRRVELGMSPGDLARALGLSLEQLIMLEAGDVPVTCKRLYEVSRALRVPMLWFFMGAPGIDLTLDLNQSALMIESSDQS